jgi:serine/threonine-protein kinase
VSIARLDHPNIVRILSHGEVDGMPYLVMPLMTGGTLAKRLKDGPVRQLPQHEAAELVRDVALGVHHAHQRGLIHRDLKPGNILLDRDGVPHVADFGLARQIDVTVSLSGAIAGTVPYMAPEQARGEVGLTTAVDVHALGAILFELLTGCPPFGTGEMASVLRRVMEDTALPVSRFRPDVDRDLEAICLKCLEKQPEARYVSAKELAEELDAYLHGRAVKARPPGFWDWLRQLARTRPEPNEEYSKPVLVWYGAVLLATNLVVYGLVRYDGPALGVWAANTAASAILAVVLWWYMMRRFRRLPTTERHSFVIGVGNKIFVYFPLMVAYVPFSLTVPARDAMALYAPLSAVTGLSFFILGSTHWSRFFLIGLGMMWLVPVMTRWPEESPLVYGSTLALVMWYWASSR